MCGDSSFSAPAKQVAKSTGKPSTRYSVGEHLGWTESVDVGQTVKFTYNGGTGRGQRTVLVQKVNGRDGLEGLTLERDGDYRAYSADKIVSDIVIVNAVPALEAKAGKPTSVAAPAVTNQLRVRFDLAGEKLLASLSGEQLAELYSKHVALEGDGASFDKDSGEVVVKLPTPKVSSFEVPKTGTKMHQLGINNKKGDTLKLFFYPDSNRAGVNVLKANSGESIVSTNITPEQLRDELVKHLTVG
jgi:hypothetical protein